MNSMSENSSPSNWANEPYIIAASRRSSSRQRWRIRPIMASCWSMHLPCFGGGRTTGVPLARRVPVGYLFLLGHSRLSGEVESILRHLYRGGIHHLAVDADRAPPGGVGLLVGLYDLSGPLDLPLRGREDLVDDPDLGRVDAPLAVEAERACQKAALPETLLVAVVGDGAVYGAQSGSSGGDDDATHGVVQPVAGVRLVPLVHHTYAPLGHPHVRGVVARAEVEGLEPIRRAGYPVYVDEAPGALYLGFYLYPSGLQAGRKLDLVEQRGDDVEVLGALYLGDEEVI